MLLKTCFTTATATTAFRHEPIREGDTLIAPKRFKTEGLVTSAKKANKLLHVFPRNLSRRMCL